MHRDPWRESPIFTTLNTEVHFPHRLELRQVVFARLSWHDCHRGTLNRATRVKRVSPTNCHPLLKNKKEGRGSLINRCQLKRVTTGDGRTPAPLWLP